MVDHVINNIKKDYVNYRKQTIGGSWTTLA